MRDHAVPHAPPQPLTAPAESPGRKVTRRWLVNALNRVNFQDGKVLVTFRHATSGESLGAWARPGPCADFELECRWVRKPALPGGPGRVGAAPPAPLRRTRPDRGPRRRRLVGRARRAADAPAGRLRRHHAQLQAPRLPGRPRPRHVRRRVTRGPAVQLEFRLVLGPAPGRRRAAAARRARRSRARPRRDGALPRPLLGDPQRARARRPDAGAAARRRPGRARSRRRAARAACGRASTRCR